jgi:hypothetical protein
MSLFNRKIELQNVGTAPTLSTRAGGLLYVQSDLLIYENSSGQSVIGGGPSTSVTKLDDLSDVVITNGGVLPTIRMNGTLNNIFIGINSGNNSATGSGNCGYGEGSILSLTNGVNNTSVGTNAGNAITTGTNQTFIGYGAGSLCTDASGNTAIGANAFSNATGGNNNSAIGEDTLQYNNLGSDNTVAGQSAGRNNSNGNFNCFYGVRSGFNNTTGSGNIYCGYESGNQAGFATLSNQFVVANNAVTQLLRGDLANSNLIIGYNGVALPDFKTATNALMLLEGTAPNDDPAVGACIIYSEGGLLKYRGNTGSVITLDGLVPYLTQNISNTGLGFEALNSIIGGANNTAYGYRTLYSLVSGNNNVAIGHSAMLNSTSGSRNIAIGAYAGEAIASVTDNVLIGDLAGNTMSTTGIRNICIGSSAGTLLAGNESVLIGHFAGSGMGAATKNVCIGTFAGTAGTTVAGMVAVGMNALANNTSFNGNTAVGYQSGMNTAAINNSYFGYNSGSANILGENLVYIGYNAGRLCTVSNNTFVGASAGADALITTRTVLVGTSAGSSLVSGADNVLIGFESGKSLISQSNNVFLGANVAPLSVTAAGSTLIGTNSGFKLNGGTNNTFVGFAAGAECITGIGNIFIGINAGNANGEVGYQAALNQFIVSNDSYAQLLRGDLGSQNLAIGVDTAFAPDFKSATKSLMLRQGAVPVNNSDVGEAIVYYNSGRLFMRAQNGAEELNRLTRQVTSIPSSGVYTVLTIPRSSGNSAFARFFFKSTIGLLLIQSGIHTVTWDNTGVNTTAHIATSTLSPSSPLAGLTWQVTNDGSTSILIQANVSSNNWQVTYTLCDLM